jgi:hypothetical protein
MQHGAIFAQAHDPELELGAVAHGAGPARDLRVLLLCFEDERTVAAGHRPPKLELLLLARGRGACAERHHRDDRDAGDRK